jgi:hypothetical protein
MCQIICAGYSKADKQQVGPAYCKAGLVILFPGRNIPSQAGITDFGPTYSYPGRHIAPRPVFRPLGRGSSVQAGIEGLGRHSSCLAGIPLCWAGIPVAQPIRHSSCLAGVSPCRALGRGSRHLLATGAPAWPARGQEATSPPALARPIALGSAPLIDQGSIQLPALCPSRTPWILSRGRTATRPHGYSALVSETRQEDKTKVDHY